MLRRITTWSAMGLLVGAILLPVAYGQRPGGGGGPGGQGGGRGGFDPEMMKQMQAMRAVESYWNLLSFSVKVNAKKLEELRPSFQKWWDAREKARAKLQKDGDFQGYGKDLKPAVTALDAAVKKSLGDALYKKLQAAAEAQAPRGWGGRGGQVGRGGPGGGGGRPGGGGGGGRPQ